MPFPLSFAGVKDHPYTANLENLNKIFENTSIGKGDSYRRTSYDENDNDLGDKNHNTCRVQNEQFSK